MGINKIVLNTDEGERTLIDISDSTVTAEKLMKGQTAYGADGEKIIGTLEPGIDTSSATATAGDIAYQKTAYVNGEKITGTLADNGNGFNMTTSNVSTAMGAFVRLSAAAAEDQIVRTGDPININTLRSNFGDATAEDVAKGKTFTSAAGLKMVGTKEDTGSAGGSDNTVFGTWVFVDDPDLTTMPEDEIDIIFVSNGVRYGCLFRGAPGSSTWGIFSICYRENYSSATLYAYTNNPEGSYGITHGWKNEAYRTITITASPDDEAFATWLRANAVKQEEAVKPEDVVGTWVFVDEPDLSTLPSQTELSFTSNGVDYDTIVHGHPGSATWGIHSLNYASVGGGVMAYTDNPGGSYGITHGWKDETYKTIVIHEEPSSSEFVTWLKANATKQT